MNVIPSLLLSSSGTSINSGSSGTPQGDFGNTYDNDLSTLQYAYDTSSIYEGGSHNMAVDVTWDYIFRKYSLFGGWSGAAVTLDNIHTWVRYQLIQDDQSTFDGFRYLRISVRFAGENDFTEVFYIHHTVRENFSCNRTRYYEHDVPSYLLTAPVEWIRVRHWLTGMHGSVYLINKTGNCYIGVGLREITATSPITDSGVRVVGGDSDSTVYYLSQHDGVPDPSLSDLQLRFGKGSTAHVFYLVDTDNSSASPLRVRTPDGTRAVRKI